MMGTNYVVNDEAPLGERSALKTETLTNNSLSETRIDSIAPSVKVKTDFRDSEFFAQTFSRVLRYNATSKKWLIWRGHSWVEDTYEIEVPNFAKYATELRIGQIQAALRASLR
jgi:hypothetical protein